MAARSRSRSRQGRSRGAADAAARVVDACAADVRVLAEFCKRVKAKAAIDEHFARSVVDCAPKEAEIATMTVFVHFLSGNVKETVCPATWSSAQLRQHITELFAVPDTEIKLRRGSAVIDDATSNVEALACGSMRLDLQAVLQWRFAEGAATNPEDALIEAAGWGHVDSVKRLLALEANPRTEATPELRQRRGLNEGSTALHAAAREGREEAVDALAKACANLNSKANGITALELAAKGGHAAVVDLLVEAGAWDSIEDSDQLDALEWAADGGHAEIVRLLLARGPTELAQHLFLLARVAEAGHTGVVEALAEAGADVDRAPDGIPALSLAAEEGHAAVVEALVKAGARIDETALQGAAEAGHLAVVQLLAARGADLEAGSPVVEAARRGHVAVVEALAEAGADIDAEDDRGRTALRWAAFEGHSAVVQLLAARGADSEAGSPITEAGSSD